jgi:hypothetical protein
MRKRVASLVQRITESDGGGSAPAATWTALDAIPIIGYHLADAIAPAGDDESRHDRATGPRRRCLQRRSRGAFDQIVLATGLRRR